MQFADNHRDNLARQCVIEEFRVDGLPHDGEELGEGKQINKKINNRHKGESIRP